MKKRVENFSQNATLYYAIDKNGQTLTPESEVENTASDFTYYGDGIFLGHYTGFVSTDDAFFNLTTGICFANRKYKIEFIAPFVDGKTYCLYGSKRFPVTTDIFASQDAYENWMQTLNYNEGIVDESPELHFPEKTAVKGYGNKTSEGIYPVILKGADAKYYYTVVDESGTQCYEPVEIPYYAHNLLGDGVNWKESLCKNGIYVYNSQQVSDEAKQTVNAILTNGKILQFTVKQEYGTPTGFDGEYIYLQHAIINIKNSETLSSVKVPRQKGGNVNSNSVTDYVQTTQTTVQNQTSSYTSVSNFNIKGKWKNVGTYTFGQVQSGAIVSFDGKNCNVVSPKDTYAIYKDGDSYTLDCTTLGFSETLSFKVKTVDKNNIHVYYGSNCLELKRVE